MPFKGVVLAGSASGALLEVANRPIVHHAIGGLAAAGVREVAVLAPVEAEDALRASFAAARTTLPEVAFLHAPSGRGVAAALLAAEEFLDGSPFVAQQADGLLVDDLRALAGGLEEDDQDALILVHRTRDGSRRHAGGLQEPTAVAGAHLFGPRFLDRTRETLRRHRDTPDINPLLADVRRCGARVETRLVEGWRRCQGDPTELLALNRQVLDDLVGAAPDLPDCSVQGRVVIDPTARVRDAVIHGPVVIGPGCTVSGAFIGPYSAIGARVRIEGAEIEDSIVLPGASILHIGGRLAASVVGRNARVFRDFAIPRALRLHVGEGAQVALR